MTMATASSASWSGQARTASGPVPAAPPISLRTVFEGSIGGTSCSGTSGPPLELLEVAQPDRGASLTDLRCDIGGRTFRVRFEPDQKERGLKRDWLGHVRERSGLEYVGSALIQPNRDFRIASNACRSELGATEATASA